ncbi:MAG: TonB-dependent receptor [Flaviaesturariibacter sp.]|nr:TonB-dependent receptor [Flaviaesturariibacter sp.]
MRLSLFTIPLILFTYSLSAQIAGEIQGRVLYGTEALPNATVSVKNKSVTSITDSTGSFSIKNLAKGRYAIYVTMIGYEPFQQGVEVKDGEIKAITIALQPSQASLNEVVVSGTLKPVQRLQSPIAVEVFTPQFFSKNPSPSIFESLQMVNGVRPQINCSVCNTGDIHINGLEGPYTMVTIDGMPIVSSLSSVYGLFGIPSQLIEKVEIIKGPASGLYGSEAIGGLINIITKDPQKAPLLSVNAMTTSWLEHNIDIGVKAKVGKATSLLGINYFHYGQKLDNNGDNFTDVTLQHRVSVFNKWNFPRRHNRVATLAGRYFYEDRWGGDMRWNKSFRGGDSLYGESIYTSRWELIGNYQLPVKERLFFSFSATSHHQNSYYGTTPYLADQRIGFGQLTWHKELGARHSSLAGLAGRYNYYDDNSTATRDTLLKTNQPERFFIPGLFLQDEWILNEKHRLLFGIRFDHHPVHKIITTPRVAYKWSLKDKQVLRLNAGTGFRVVNLFTEDHAALTGSRAVEIRGELKPERSYNLNLNYTKQFSSRSRIFSLDASAWYTYFGNQIVANYDLDPNKIIYQNLQGHSLSRGVSLNLDFNFRQRLKGSAGLTLQDVALVNKVDGKEIKQRPVLSENISGTWAITYTLPMAGLTFDYTGNIYGPMRLPLISNLDPRREYSPVWSIQNIQVTKWLSGKVEIFGGVKNLFNWTPAKSNPFLIARSHDPFDKGVEYGSDGSVKQTATNPYKLTFDPSYVYAPNQGIRAFVGVKYKMDK